MSFWAFANDYGLIIVSLYRTKLKIAFFEKMEKEMLQMKLSSENILQEMEELKENLSKMEEKNVELNSQLEEEKRYE